MTTDNDEEKYLQEQKLHHYAALTLSQKAALECKGEEVLFEAKASATSKTEIEWADRQIADLSKPSVRCIH
jgi:hypothetical protein